MPENEEQAGNSRASSQPEPYTSSPLDTSEPPEEVTSSETSPARISPTDRALDTELVETFVRRWPSPTAREALTHGVMAYDGPTGRPPFVENPNVSDEENAEAHRVWAIAGRDTEDF